jgi:outer membrane receptor protein involved in Fe transport
MGADAEIGSLASVSATYYNQVARDLIEQVVLGPPPNPLQYQNVGRIRNTGWELEATLTRGRVHAHATFSVAYSTVEDLGPDYTGDLRPGDQALYVPKTSGGLSAIYEPWHGCQVYGAIRYVGRWTGYDATAVDAYLLGYTYLNAPPTSYRVFWESFPAFGKGNVGLSQALTKQISLLLDIYNVTNNPAIEQNQLYATTGRTTVLRVNFHY